MQYHGSLANKNFMLVHQLKRNIDLLPAAKIHWVTHLLCELGIKLQNTPAIYIDNIGTTRLSANLVFQSRIKHLGLIIISFANVFKVVSYVLLVFIKMINLHHSYRIPSTPTSLHANIQDWPYTTNIYLARVCKEINYVANPSIQYLMTS